MKTLPTLLFTMLALTACEQHSTQIPASQLAPESSPSAPGMVATSGPMTITISRDGRLVTVSNATLRRSIQVDVVQRCGAHGIGDPNKYDLEYTNTELRLTYGKRCLVKIPHDASGSSCSSCD